MQIALIGSSDSWYSKDLQRAITDSRFQSASISTFPFHSIRAEIFNGSSTVFFGDMEARQFDAVLVRSMPPGSLEQVVLRMDLLWELERQGTAIINPPKSMEIAIDKYLCLTKLIQAGIPIPDTIACEDIEQAMNAFEQLGKDVLLKPIFGGEGRGIVRINDEEILLRCLKAITQVDAVIYLQRFIPNAGYDIRLLVVGDEVFAMKRKNESSWKTNIAAGATAEKYDPNEQEIEIARRSCDAVGAIVAGVDLIYETTDAKPQGDPYVLEVNAVPGWKAISKCCQMDVASKILECVRR